MCVLFMFAYAAYNLQYRYEAVAHMSTFVFKAVSERQAFAQGFGPVPENDWHCDRSMSNADNLQLQGISCGVCVEFKAGLSQVYIVLLHWVFYYERWDAERLDYVMVLTSAC